MKFGLTLVLLASLALGQDCDTKQTCESAGDAVATARKDLRIARTEFKRLTRFERDAIGGARETYFKSTHGKALAPMFAAAANALHLAAADPTMDKKRGKLVRAASGAFRDMARAIDGKKSHQPVPPDAKSRRFSADKAWLAKWEKVTATRLDKDSAAAWSLMKKGDPRLRAMAANLKALTDSFKVTTALKPGAEDAGLSARAWNHITNAQKLTAQLVKHFDGVPTVRPAKPAEATQAPT